MYSLKLNDENRIMYVTKKKYASNDMIDVESFPEGDLHDYQYINGEYVFNPLQKPEVVPSESEDILSMIVDHEYRLALLELGLNE